MASKPATRIQIPIRGQGQTTCPDHQSEVLCICKNCDGQLVCLQCITSTHNGHEFDNISDVASIKKQKIHDFVKKAEKTKLPQIRLNIESIDQKSKDNSAHVKKLIERIQSQGEKLKSEIDRITRELINTCRKTEQNKRDLLSKYGQELQTVYAELSWRVEKCKNAQGNKTTTSSNITNFEIY